MRRVLLVVILCLIVSAEIACSHRTAGPVQLPSMRSAVRQQEPRRPTDKLREAIESAKKKLQGSPGSPAPAEATAEAVAASGDASNPATGIGTSGGALSVETRYPASPDNTASQPPPRRRALTRAGDAIRGAAEGASIWVIGLCALAAALIVALLMRRPRHSA